MIFYQAKIINPNATVEAFNLYAEKHHLEMSLGNRNQTDNEGGK